MTLLHFTRFIRLFLFSCHSVVTWSAARYSSFNTSLIVQNIVRYQQSICNVYAFLGFLCRISKRNLAYRPAATLKITFIFLVSVIICSCLSVRISMREIFLSTLTEKSLFQKSGLTFKISICHEWLLLICYIYILSSYHLFGFVFKGCAVTHSDIVRNLNLRYNCSNSRYTFWHRK